MPVEVTCQICGKVSHVPPSVVGRKKYCSWECRKQGLSLRYKGRPGTVHLFGEYNPNWRGKTTQRDCPICGKVFTKYQKAATCSDECGHRLQNMKISGPGNGNWKDEETYLSKRCRELVDTSKCECCSAENEWIDVHHRDGNWRNNDVSNLQPLCRSCHQFAHVNLRAIPRTWSQQMEK